MEPQNPGSTDLLIDLTGIESVPFPQQLITAEMDDTFGLFGPAKLRSHSAQTSTGSFQTTRQAPDVFSPVMDHASQYLQDDSVFVDSYSTAGTPTLPKNDRMLRPGSSDAETLSSGMSKLGLNDAFVGSTNSSIAASATFNESKGSVQANAVSSVSSIMYERVTSFGSSSGSGGGISAITADDFRLADLDDTSESMMPLVKQTPHVDNDPCDIISQVLDRRKSVGRKPVDDDIARQIQEMFDAASPTKNPDFYSRSFRHSLTPARKAPTHEPFSYATPRRVAAPSLNSSIGSNITPIPIAAGQNPYMMKTADPDKVQQKQVDISNDSFKANNHPSVPGVLKDLNSDSPERLRTPKRLSFSTSSSSEPDPDSAPPAKMNYSELNNFAKPVGYSLPRLRQPQALAKSGSQPLKALHHAVPKVIEPADLKLAKHYGTVSAPVRRKFASPMAASSPISVPLRAKNKEVQSSGYGRPQPNKATALSSAFGANHGIFKLPSSGRALKPPAESLAPPPTTNRRNSTGPAIQRRSYASTSGIQPPEMQTQLSIPSTSRRSLMKENAPSGYRL